MSEEQKTPPAEEATGKKGLISRLVKLWTKVQAVLFTVMPVIIGLVLIGLIIREVNQDSIEVAPIQVPARLAATGLTAEVVSIGMTTVSSRAIAATEV